MKVHERWWHNNWETRQGDLDGWLRESDPTSRSAIVQITDRLGPTDPISVLECGPGLFYDYRWHWSKRPAVSYTGLDVTPQIVEHGRSLGLTMALGSIEEIPFPEDSFDLVYCRHVLEHLPSYRNAIVSMLRASRQAVTVAFFRLDPNAITDQVAYNTVADVPDTFHNTYSKAAVSAWLDSLGVEYEWEQTASDWVLTIWKRPPAV